jgi:hypothetical protein
MFTLRQQFLLARIPVRLVTSTLEGKLCLDGCLMFAYVKILEFSR